MKKKLNEDVIKNELERSAFFQKAQSPTPSSKDSVDEIEGIPSKTNNHDVKQPRVHETTVPRYHDTTLEQVRKALKAFGKEAATHRFTQLEKREIADLIYLYKKRNIRTSENEITRIAVNFIINDQKESGEESILNRVIKLLYE
ncbi:MAG: hypothetical protein PVF83_14090 [Anaerolineales bacterium]|jgi:hypothetical protein